jgi:hypothetical protein
VPTVIGGAINKANSDAVYAAAMKARPIANFAQSVRMTGKYGTPYDVPRKWSDGTVMTVRDRIASGKLSIPSDPQMSTNTLLPDWQNLWEAVRLDISIRKMEKPTVRQFLYNEIQAPNASRTMNISELFPFGVVFDENNGEGQAVPRARRSVDSTGPSISTSTQPGSLGRCLRSCSMNRWTWAVFLKR